MTLWLGADGLAVEFAGDTLARYEVEHSSAVTISGAAGRLRDVKRPRLFENPYQRTRSQPRLFTLEALGDDGWLRVIKLNEHAPRKPVTSQQVQQSQEMLFPLQAATRGTT